MCKNSEIVCEILSARICQSQQNCFGELLLINTFNALSVSAKQDTDLLMWITLLFPSAVGVDMPETQRHIDVHTSMQTVTSVLTHIAV